MPAATMYSGDTQLFQIAVRNQQNDPVSVEDALGITFGIFDHTGAPRVIKTIGSGLMVAAHIISVQIAPANTADLIAGEYIMECEVTLANGDVRTVLQEKLHILRDYIG